MAQEISKRRLNRLLELNKKLADENDFSKRIKLISDTIKDILKVERFTLFMHDKSGKSMWSVYIDGISYIEIPENEGLVGKAYKTKKVYILNDLKGDKNYNLIDEGSRYKTKSVLVMPIIGYDDDVLGVIELINKTDGTQGFSQEDEKILNYVLGHISAYLEVMVQEK